MTGLLRPDGPVHLAWTGLETEPIFDHGIDLPGFASHPLLDTQDGRRLLRDALAEQIDVARAHGLGAVLEGPTWTASRDRGAAIGTGAATLARRNREAVALMADLRDERGHAPVVPSGNVGPRSDAYAPAERMTAEEAEAHHAEQIGWLADTAVDVVSGYTIAYPEEAIGIVRAARARGLPAVIAFTVETDGRLPVGTPLGEAIEAVDEPTDGHAAHHMINCAHPDHFADVLAAARGAPWTARLGGVVANASRRSHAELDAARTLDDGDPEELARQLADPRRAHPQFARAGRLLRHRHATPPGPRTRARGDAASPAHVSFTPLPNAPYSAEPVRFVIGAPAILMTDGLQGGSRRAHDGTRNLRTRAVTSSGRSSIGMWATPGRATCAASGIRRATSRASACMWGKSSSPQQTIAGAVISPSRSQASAGARSPVSSGCSSATRFMAMNRSRAGPVTRPGGERGPSSHARSSSASMRSRSSTS